MALGEHGEQHVLATLGGVGVAAEQTQEQRYCRAERRAGSLGVVVPGSERRSTEERFTYRKLPNSRLARGDGGVITVDSWINDEAPFSRYPATRSN